MVNRQGSVQ